MDILQYVERVNVPATTYGAAAVIHKAIAEAEGVHNVIVAVRKGSLNDYATTVLLVAASGSKLFDTANLTAERPPREAEVLELFEFVANRDLLSKTRFVNEIIPSTSDMTGYDAAKLISTYPLSEINDQWVNFLALYGKNLKRFPDDSYYIERWKKLA